MIITFFFITVGLIFFFHPISGFDIFLPYYKSIIKSSVITFCISAMIYLGAGKIKLSENLFNITKKKIYICLILWIIFFHLFRRQWFHPSSQLPRFVRLRFCIYWNMFRGNFYYSTILGHSALAHHFSPLMILNGLIYKILPLPIEGMFFIRSFFLALGGLAVYHICVEKKITGLVSFIIVQLYFIYPVSAYYALDIFHPEDYIIVLILWSYLFVLKKKYILSFFLLMVTMTAKEDAAITIALFSLIYYFISGKNKIYIFSFIAAIAYFVIVFYTVMPALRESGFEQFWNIRYSGFGGSLAGIIKSTVLNPLSILKKMYSLENIAYIALLMVPLFFLPLKSYKYILPFLPALYLNLIADYSPQKQICNCYQYAFLTVVWICLIDSIAAMDNVRRMRISLALLSSCILANYFWGPFPYARIFYMTKNNPYHTDAKFNRVTKLVTQIPESAFVCATEKTLPHLSHKKKIQWPGIELKYPESFQKPIISYSKPDYYLLDLSEEDSHHFSEENKFKYTELVHSVLADTEYLVSGAEGQWLLLKKVIRYSRD